MALNPVPFASLELLMSDMELSDRPFVAGMYDYYLGGTANSAADRAAVERIKAVVPEVVDAAYVGEWGAEDPLAADDDGSRVFSVAVARKP
jgi:hypothetical protein